MTDEEETCFVQAILRAEKRGARERSEQIKSMIMTALDADSSLLKIIEAIDELDED